MAYEPSSVDYTDPRMQYAAKPDQLDAHRVRSRASSTVRNDGNLPEQYRHGQLQRNPPIDDVVTTAVKTAETSTHVPPELIAQITASVINQLKSTGIDGGTPIPPPPPPMQQPVPLSPSTISASSPSMPSRNMHTPPSPHKPSDFWGRGSPPAQSSFAQAIPMSPSPHAQFHDRRTSSPLSQSSESGYTRPRGPTRLSTSREETTLEKIWGQLFDEDSNPTARLSDFLRGLAVHIVRNMT